MSVCKFCWCSCLLVISISELAEALVTGFQEKFIVYKVTPTESGQLEFLVRLWHNSSNYDLDFWQPPSKIDKDVHVMVSGEGRSLLLRLFNDWHLEPTIRIPDSVGTFIPLDNECCINCQARLHLYRLIEEKQNPVRRTGKLRLRDSIAGVPRFNLGKFHSHNEMLAYMRELSRRYPRWTSIVEIGRTHEGRPIQVFKAGKPQTSVGAGGAKPGIWIDAGIHSREWVSPATAMFFIHQLATGYETDPKIRQLVDNLDWYILPLMNPDGYEYSRSSTDPRTRLWRKNRSPSQCSTNGRFSLRGTCCQGVDLNRNFDFHWGESGSSQNPCEEIYQGSAPFSEPETRAVRDFLSRRPQNFQAFITMHSYSQIWMYPFGHRRRDYPPDVADLKTVAIKARAALQSLYGTKYQVGTGADTLCMAVKFDRKMEPTTVASVVKGGVFVDPASGGSDDWAKSKAGIKYVYLLELRPEDHVWDGFIIDEREILPTAKETWEGIKVVADAVMSRNGLQSVTGNNIYPPTPQNRVTDNSGNRKDCEDKESQCRIWASLGGCQAWQGLTTRCPLSCGACAPTPPCKDDRLDCPSWKRMNLCNWVRNSCKKSCDNC